MTTAQQHGTQVSFARFGAAFAKAEATPLKTREQVKAEFRIAGISVTGWARTHGFNRMTVVDLLRGTQQGLRGEAHRAAVALGMKVGHVTTAQAFMPAQPRPHTAPDRRARKAA